MYPSFLSIITGIEIILERVWYVHFSKIWRKMGFIVFYVALCDMTSESNILPQSSVKILAVSDLACYWLQLINKLSENCKLSFFLVRRIVLCVDILMTAKSEVSVLKAFTFQRYDDKGKTFSPARTEATHTQSKKNPRSISFFSSPTPNATSPSLHPRY